MYEITDNDKKRFWDKVDKTSDCWIWTSQLRSGYGLFRINGKVVSAHRLSYEMSTGKPVPRGIHICHSCDNPACVNPKHLFMGTAKANNDDKMLKDRHRFKLSNDQVIDIRSREHSVTMCRDLAKEFGVSPTEIKNILVGKTYGWIDGAREIPPQWTAHKLTPKDVEEILEELETPWWGQMKYLSEKYGITRDSLYKIKSGSLKYTDTA